VVFVDVRRLRLLRDLAIHGTVSATAQALHLTGPAVSQQLATLEKEAGVPLLEKQGRTLRLTSAGRLMVEHAEVILAGLAAAEADLKALRAGGLGTVRIAAFGSAARVLLPAVWRRLADGLELRLAEMEPGPAVTALRQREADVAIVHGYNLLPLDLLSGCEQHPLLEEPVLLALHTRHGIADGAPVDLADFAGARWLMPGPETSCHELTRRACGAAGFVPRPVAVASDFTVLVALVAVDAGVALVPRMALPSTLDNVTLHPLTHSVTRTVLALTATGDARQPHLRRILDDLRAAADERTTSDQRGTRA
jgi:DNA-binding transcriptional LysR family regulator